MSSEFKENRALAQAASAQAATELIARRRAGRVGARLPEACRPADTEQGWQIQQLVTLGLNHAVAGWKCALPTAGKLVAAPIYADAVHRAPRVPLATTTPVRFEPEIGYLMAHDLPPRAEPYRPHEVDAAVGHACCALEVIASRYALDAEVPFAEQLADGLLNSGVVLGPVVDDRDWQNFDLAVEVDGAVQSYPARHPDAHPRAGLYWLANFLGQRGLGLQAGQVVITGSLAGVLTWPAARQIALRYGDLAAFDFSFHYPELAQSPPGSA
ncbi:MAG: fumarylacetoacetate hydrolase family protein [Rhodoferax sp.]|uniref:fumarylacetoacetate hydrolase family protein n=1 Tax=Rhodoferax sp. TaxID=50421 RepID=UPI00326664CE